MRLAIISGSHRPKSQSIKVATYIDRLVAKDFSGVASVLLDLANTQFTFWWLGGQQEGGAMAAEDDAPAPRKIIAEADGLVVVTPEWHGMAPPGLKSFFLALDGQEAYHKPCLLIAISATAGGSYPIAELRMSGYKNSRICFLPEHVIIRNVKQVLNNPDESASAYDTEIRQRLHLTVGQLVAYAGALVQVRNSDFVKTFPYKWGM